MVRELLGALAVFAGMQVGAAASCKGRACSCTGIEFGRPLKKYEQSVACIYLGDQKAMFYPRVDEYAVLEVPGFNATGNGTNMWMAVEGMGTVGQNEKLGWVDHSKPWYSNPTGKTNGGTVYPFLTAIVTINAGVIERVQWNSGCTTCSPSSADVCVPDQSGVKCSKLEPPADLCYDCAIQKSECATAEQCVPRIYVAWIGTDAKGNPCTSAGKVISRFRGSSLSGLYESSSQSSVTLTPEGGQPIPQGSSSSNTTATTTTPTASTNTSTS